MSTEASVYALLRSIRYNATHGSQDRPMHERLRLIAQDANEAIAAIERTTPPTPSAPQVHGGDGEVVIEVENRWSAEVVEILSCYGFAPEAAAVFASAEMEEYRAGLCECAELAPVDMVDLLMDVAVDAVEKWKRESVGRPYGHKATTPPTPSAPVVDDAIKAAAIRCARRAYGFWRGGSNGSWEALEYFDGGYVGRERDAAMYEAEIRAALSGVSAPVGVEAPAYGIIDPDYARVFTIARCLAWAEGYALAMQGSFTRDLDLLAVPWTDAACEPAHLARRIEEATGLRITHPSKEGEKPHGRLVWTLKFTTFGDPRFIDLSVMPRLASTGSAPAPSAVPEGFALVPVEPTDAMLDAAIDVRHRIAQTGSNLHIGKVWSGEIYAAMLAAAPTQEPHG